MEISSQQTPKLFTSCNSQVFFPSYAFMPHVMFPFYHWTQKNTTKSKNTTSKWKVVFKVQNIFQFFLIFIAEAGGRRQHQHLKLHKLTLGSHMQVKCFPTAYIFNTAINHLDSLKKWDKTVTCVCIYILICMYELEN